VGAVCRVIQGCNFVLRFTINGDGLVAQPWSSNSGVLELGKHENDQMHIASTRGHRSLLAVKCQRLRKTRQNCER
jgi:hypothetical protein